MPIVVITIEGESKTEFVNSLHAKTGGAVALVVVQKKPPMMPLERVRVFFKKNNTIRAIYFAALLCLNRPLRRKLDYFRLRDKKTSETNGWVPPVMYVASVNSDAVYKKLSEISPSLIVIWGAGILKKHIIQTAKQTINLHLGLAPYYRGAVGNQFAVFHNDISRIGVTIHHVNHEADMGDIIETILPDTKKPPIELFGALNSKAEERFGDIAARLYNGENLPRTKQDRSLGKTFLLKQWTPEIRYKVGKKISQWGKKYLS
ncbi:MAG: formyltransferase family protein [bacterium]|nr:formyltransferase family protein [bacterium]